MSGIPAGAGSLLGKRLGKFEILALLALGGTAEIYLARIGGAAGFEKYVVVKCLHDHLADDQEFVKMFLDEARLAAHLDHSNIVQTMELGEHENRYYMVMEFLAGLSLAMVVRRVGERMPGGVLPVALVMNVMAQACAGLHYAHDRVINGKALNIVHRDISPQNLVVSFEGVVKVVDFGIAKAELRETQTRSGTIKGKFAYMSPEQCVAKDVDRRTDVFALGVIAHELLTGRRLFKKNSPYETYQAVMECNVAPPSKLNVQLDPAIDAIVMKAVAKEKENRYPTAEAFGDAILGYLHHRGKGSGPSDLGRFFDEHFTQEIEEHGARMRELISGQELAADTGVKWDAEEAKRNQTVDLGGRKQDDSEEASLSLSTGDLISLDRQSSASISDLIGELGNPTSDGEGDDDDDMPADRTRIEANPLERISDLEPPEKPTMPLSPTIGARQQPAGKPPGKPVMPPSGPLPLPAPPPVVPGPYSTTQAAQMSEPPSGAPLPRVGSIGGPPPRPSGFPNLSHLPTQIAEPELARTEVAGGGVIVDPDFDVQPPTQRDAQTLPPQNGDMVRSQRPTADQNVSLPTSYPVMSAQMSAQMMSGNVYPSQPSHGRPSQPNDGTQRPSLDGGAHAASFMSPVGQQYPQQVDWSQAAAMPARAIPPWMLAVIFVGAIGIALAVTIIIAKIAS